MVLRKQFFERVRAVFTALKIDSPVLSKHWIGLTKLLLTIQIQYKEIKQDEMSF